MAQLRTPEGTEAGSMDRVMLLATWTMYLQCRDTAVLSDGKEAKDTKPRMIMACMGKPTFPISLEYLDECKNRYADLRTAAAKARTFLPADTPGKRTEIAHIYALSSYTNPQGADEAREVMAAALTREEKIAITKENILFTTGASGGLHVVFKTINENKPRGRIISWRPTYPLHSGVNNNMYYLEGPQTAEVLKKGAERASREAKRDGQNISAFLFCDPHNPEGSILGEKWIEIAKVLKLYPTAYIIIDEAYQGVTLYEDYRSILHYAPELKNRIIRLITSTKDGSTAGERAAMIVVFNSKLMTKLLAANMITYGYPQVVSQYAYAAAMYALTPTEKALKRAYYRAKVELVEERAAKMGINIPGKDKVKGAFYVTVDVSDLLGLPISPEAKQALGERAIAQTDEDIAYDLIFDYRIVLAPLSYFGIKPTLGRLRITCTDEDETINELMDRLEHKLKLARALRQEQLISAIEENLKKLAEFNSTKTVRFKKDLAAICSTPLLTENLALHLKLVNVQLKNLASQIDYSILQERTRADSKLAMQAAIKIQAIWRSYHSRKANAPWIYEKQCQEYKLWCSWVKHNFALEGVQTLFFTFNAQNRARIKPWQSYLQAYKRANWLKNTDDAKESKVEIRISVSRASKTSSSSSSFSSPLIPSDSLLLTLFLPRSTGSPEPVAPNVLPTRSLLPPFTLRLRV